ncbi:RagB/SusD family nutrient uptake outer membrane protein [soil metagenome]
MKNNIAKKILIALLAAVPFGACNDFIDIKPQQSLATSVALGDIAGLNTALAGAYDGMQSLNYYGRDFVVFGEARGDNTYIAVSNSNRFLFDYNYQLSANTTQTVFWNAAWAANLDANNIINTIANVKDGTQAARDQILGEALMIRAICHFDLVRVFAKPYYDGAGAQPGIPIKLDSKIVDIPRSTVAQVYDQVVSDITLAKSKMVQPAVTDPYHWSPLAADALLARVLLYKGDNANAEAAATRVITSGKYSLANLATLWGAPGSVEEIFTLRTLAAETRGSDNLGQIFNPGSGYGDIRVTSDIRTAFGAGPDARIAASYYLYSNGAYYVNKYIGESAIPGLTSPKILRLAEMYLIRAEARSKQNNFAGTDADLAVIRTRAGAAALAATNASTALNSVLAEKRLEFAFEGHRSFDLFRNAKDLVRIQCNTGIEVNVAGFCSVSATSNLRVYPIPQRELDANKAMTQNDGY